MSITPTKHKQEVIFITVPNTFIIIKKIKVISPSNKPLHSLRQTLDLELILSPPEPSLSPDFQPVAVVMVN
jgi:hypothetical protein